VSSCEPKIPKTPDAENRLASASARASLPRVQRTATFSVNFSMSEKITHECGVAVVRLLKPLSHYYEKYGTPIWGFNKLFLLMEKQHNRGQDGAGIACVKLNMPPGEAFMFRERQVEHNPLDLVFKNTLARYNALVADGTVHPEFPETVKRNFDFGGELLMGHLRYGTSGGYSLSSCHPFFRRSPWPARNLALCGNFNMTNTGDLNRALIAIGQHPIFATDTQAVLEKIGYCLDEEHAELHRKFRNKGLGGQAAAKRVSEDFDPARVITRAATDWDGGYALCGLLGNGDLFVARDPAGIRPCWYFQNDEVIAFASERAPLMTVFDTSVDDVREVEPGDVMVVKNNGALSSTRFTTQQPNAACSFERVYFSRGNDPEIYRERKALGGHLAAPVLKAINGDLGHTIFSAIPNTAEVAYLGLLHELRNHRRAQVKQAIIEIQKSGRDVDDKMLDELIMDNWPRSERVVGKDIKLRTFIGTADVRVKLASHVYDITYGAVPDGWNLVCIDDSIVRGTTLRQSILRMLARLNPGKIVIASTAPQIRYPDCYGIDMAEFGKLVAFEAAISLLRETGREQLINDVYCSCIQAIELKEPVNHVQKIYAPFTPEELSARIAQLVRPRKIEWKGDLEFVFQTIENLHAAIPNHPGDWYFSGNYPTPGGFRVVNQAFINWHESREGRVS
jgi:amidophosphoribosyltransferase